MSVSLVDKLHAAAASEDLYGFDDTASLLREAAAALTSLSARKASQVAGLIRAEASAAMKVKALPRAPEDQSKIGWALPVELLSDVAKKVTDAGWGSPTIEVVEIAMLEAERRILSALATQPAAHEGEQEAAIGETPSKRQRRLCDHSVSRANGERFCVTCGLPARPAEQAVTEAQVEAAAKFFPAGTENGKRVLARAALTAAQEARR